MKTETIKIRIIYKIMNGHHTCIWAVCSLRTVSGFVGSWVAVSSCWADVTGRSVSGIGHVGSSDTVIALVTVARRCRQTDIATVLTSSTGQTVCHIRLGGVRVVSAVGAGELHVKRGASGTVVACRTGQWVLYTMGAYCVILHCAITVVACGACLTRSLKITNNHFTL